MRRFLFVVWILVSVSFETVAFVKPHRPTRQEIESENIVLRHRLDSMVQLLDSFSRRKYLEDSTMAAVMEGNSESAEPLHEYSPDESDSLMQLWMKNHQLDWSASFDISSPDSLHYSSNVPDEEMMRRLKSLNPYITLPFNETVRDYMVKYAEKMPDAMSRMMGRCSYYMPIIETALSKYGLPQELKYMAIIESGLNPTATSRAGARGIWQFMYVTAKAYGLKINSFVDERLDVEKSVDAAARYLKDSYRIFGDWNLAISAYNCGAGNVLKAIRRAGSNAFWDIYPYLPRETRGYVPALVGVMYAMNYAREYGLEPKDMGFPAVTDTFEIRRNLHFRQIYEVVGIPQETLKELNPQYIHDVIPGQSGPQVLKIPFNWTPAFVSANPDSLYLHKSGELLSSQVLKNIEDAGHESRVAYKVRSGDYLGRIASRYHVTVQQLMKWNHLRNTNLRIGQIIYIYKKS